MEEFGSKSTVLLQDSQDLVIFATFLVQNQELHERDNFKELVLGKYFLIYHATFLKLSR